MRKTGLWKFNNILLHEMTYVSEIKKQSFKIVKLNMKHLYLYWEMTK